MNKEEIKSCKDGIVRKVFYINSILKQTFGYFVPTALFSLLGIGLLQILRT